MPHRPLAPFPQHRPLLLPDLALPANSSIVVLAPHPDDFDAIAITMRHLHRQGHEIHLAVLTSGANGVEDGWQGAHGAAQKTALREAEQRASCSFFGLPMERLVFMRLWEGNDQQQNEQEGRQVLRAYLHARHPALVFLPHGNDSNRTHRRTYEAFHAIAAADGLQLHACLNLDAKTVSMRPDLYAYFGEEEAAWKAQLLRFHRSQQDRNLKTRGQGFDQRVLDVNRQAAADAGGLMPYAEVFELRAFGL
ncbi:PIG-L deacetylase family protein [Noviherbaspirillum soli]|uniref:PIG-L deacetylase family protein n=1 Tax=Noviherbaspirillum soli TaxID=1064518 RepID=UPI00188DAE4F|nr:PIG-L family deacetylase [Noviherbaspirillum soli]